MSELITHLPLTPKETITPEMESAAQVERIADKIGYIGLQSTDLKGGLFKDREVVGITRNQEWYDNNNTSFTHDVAPRRIGKTDKTESHVKLKLDPTREDRKKRTQKIATPYYATSLSGKESDSSGNTRVLSHQESRDAAAKILWKASRSKIKQARGEKTEETREADRRNRREYKEFMRNQPGPTLSDDDKLKIVGTVLAGPIGYGIASAAIRNRNKKK
jgi:hypothetical protein